MGVTKIAFEAVQPKNLLHSIGLLALSLGYVAGQLIHSPIISLFTQSLALIILLESLIFASGILRVVAFVMLTLGSVLMWQSGAGVQEWLNGFGQNVGIISLFVLVPQLAIPLRLKRYTEALSELYRVSVNTRGRLYLLTTFLTHFLSIILNFGSVSLVFNLVRNSPLANDDRLVLTAINRGFATSLMWSPYFAAIAVVLSQIHVSWLSILPVVFTVAMTGLIWGFILDYRRIAVKSAGGSRHSLDKKSRVVLINLFASGLGLTLFMIAAERLIGMSMILIVDLVAMLFPLAWGFRPGHERVYKSGIKSYFSSTLPLIRNEVVLFLSSGFFSASIAASGAGIYLAMAVQPLAGYGTFGVLLTIHFMVAFCALAGIHPIVSVSVLAVGLQSAIVGLTDHSLAVALLSSWAICNINSPFSAVNMVLAHFTGRTSFEVGPRWNLVYLLTIIFIACVIETLAQNLFGL